MPKVGAVDPNKIGIFTAQYSGLTKFKGDFPGLAKLMADTGYKYLQLTPGDFDLDRAAEDVDYCNEFKAQLAELGLGISEISFHIAGQLMAVHPAYFEQYKGFLPEEMREGATMQTMYEYGRDMTIKILKASKNFGLDTVVGFTGSLIWPYAYPWPQRPAGLVKTAMKELAARWEPVIAVANELGIKLAFELHPGEDIHDGYSFYMFLSALIELGIDAGLVGINFDPSHFVLQSLDYLLFIDVFHDRIFAYHAKDGELNTNGEIGVYGGFAPWSERAGKFKTPGTGQVDFKAIADKFAKYGVDVIAIVEWEDPIQDAVQGARWALNYLVSGEYPDENVIETDEAFDSFAASGADMEMIATMLGLTKFHVSDLVLS